jgi:hypothetical protein
MTFTEAALAVLRSVEKPLHYKKITEIAIERNLLSHVGKTPEITMSARLATLVKKDRGTAPIIKVRPGVFAARKVVDQASNNEDAHLRQPAEGMVGIDPFNPENDSSSEAATPEALPALPGVDLFPEEEDDNEPILSNLESEEHSDDEEVKGRRRRRRRRRGKSEGDNDSDSEQFQPYASPDNARRQPDFPKREPYLVKRSNDEVKRSNDEREQANNRQINDADLLGKDLADAVWTIISRQEKYPVSFARAAELLVRRGRLTGTPAALAPTIAAAIRADISRAELSNTRPRFRIRGNRIGLTDWLLPRDVVRSEEAAVRAAERQREQVRRALVYKLQGLPTEAFAEVIATWLNAEGVVALRAIRRTGGSNGQLHFAGTLRRGTEETRLAIVVMRDGRSIDRERVIEVRGGLHHYGNATAAWMITTGRVVSGAREEAAAIGAPQCSLFDEQALAEAMERLGVGIKRNQLPVASLDFDLFEAVGERNEFRERDRDRDRGEREFAYDRNQRRGRDRNRLEDNSWGRGQRAQEVRPAPIAIDNEPKEEAEESESDIEREFSQDEEQFEVNGNGDRQPQDETVESEDKLGDEAWENKSDEENYRAAPEFEIQKKDVGEDIFDTGISGREVPINEPDLSCLRTPEEATNAQPVSIEKQASSEPEEEQTP